MSTFPDTPVDLTRPIRAVVPTLDGPVLEVLSRTTRPLTGREVQRIANVASPSGVQRVLTRLVEQGVVHAAEHSTAIFYTANREHLAWPAVEILAGILRTLLGRLEDEFSSWQPKPIHASLYGSAARGDGDTHSDIDIFIVRPTGVDEDESPWAEQIDGLRHHVGAWTGNRCQAFQVSLARLAQHARVGDPLVDNWLKDSVTLVGTRPRVLLRQLSTSGDER